ncbi:hypothetical protein [Halobellus clavatus]|jgi:hypothetical protein|uniref:Uncharacterized protein n=1 Tax=Halobellus clavatus TaxID=660517 RepID=A0A1H3DF90_9EURY|nr:hypothetical protein [Halobellus clavatus]SDX64349.1 hypothetical protein SAMN04487946_101502 [Halobellus clavatus]
MCHYSDRPREPTHESLEELLAEHTTEDEAEEDPGFTEMEEAEDVEIVTDGGE